MAAELTVERRASLMQRGEKEGQSGDATNTAQTDLSTRKRRGLGVPSLLAFCFVHWATQRADAERLGTADIPLPPGWCDAAQRGGRRTIQEIYERG